MIYICISYIYIEVYLSFKHAKTCFFPVAHQRYRARSLGTTIKPLMSLSNSAILAAAVGL